MALLSLLNKVRTVLAKTEVKPNNSQRFSNLSNNQVMCSGDVCSCTWKPSRNEHLENGQQLSQNSPN